MTHPVEEFEKYRQELNRSTGLGEWSLRDVLNHLSDSDLVSATRIRMIVTQDRPTLVGYDQEAWTARFGRLDATAQEIIDRWQVLRRANLRLLESLSPEEWERVGLHTERGPESVRLTVQLAAGHDRVHLDQFRWGMN